VIAKRIHESLNKIMFDELTLLKRRRMIPFVLYVPNLIKCPQPLQSGSSALCVINEPKFIAPVSMTSLFVAAAILMTLMGSHLYFDVLR
jgi:hypothetical protein